MFTQQVAEYFEQCFTMPVLPATVLMMLIVSYGFLVILGALDFELFDFDLDVDADADIGAFTSVGFVTLKFFNIGEVPVMIWVSIYGLAWWTISLLLLLVFDQTSVDSNATLLVVRNIAASVLLTKFVTAPLAKFFAKPPRFRPEDLIGRECEISTFEATAEFGQAKCQTEAAPLILDVKLDVKTSVVKLTKGERAFIVDYDSEQKIHYVVAASEPP